MSQAFIFHIVSAITLCVLLFLLVKSQLKVNFYLKMARAVASKKPIADDPKKFLRKFSTLFGIDFHDDSGNISTQVSPIYPQIIWDLHLKYQLIGLAIHENSAEIITSATVSENIGELQKSLSLTIPIIFKSKNMS